MSTTTKFLFVWVLFLVALSLVTHLFWDCAVDAFAKALASAVQIAANAIAAAVFGWMHF